MAQHKDESVSPMTRSLRSESPSLGVLAPNGSANPVTRQSGLRTELASDGTDGSHGAPTPGLLQTGKEASQEAADYLNDGLPHDSPMVFANGSSTAMAPGRASPKPTSESTDFAVLATGTSTPPGRRSVQFARPDTTTEPTSQLKQEVVGQEDSETPSKDKRGASLMSKLKSLASTGGLQTHVRNLSGGGLDRGVSSTPDSPTLDRNHRVPHTLEEEGSDMDADAEETADENAVLDATKTRRKRRAQRSSNNGSQTAPTTPHPQNIRSDSPAAASPRGHFTIGRRATMPDGLDEQRGGLSEGEGRERLGKQSAWRRGGHWIGASRGQSYSGDPPPEEGDGTPSGRRPGQFRRLTGTNGVSDGETHSPKRPFLGGERATTFGAQRWKMLKHGLKLLGQKKEEHKIDYMKSAELMAELRAGAPAALMLASMIQRDEHGNKRIPVLLEQVKIKITDSKSTDETKDSERHLIFRIELEYGSGLNRMKWVINRSLIDFINLHVRYKLQGSSDKYIQLRDVDSRPKQPRFPKSAFPYLRGVRGLGESEDEELDRIDETAADVTHSETDRPGKRKKRHPSLGNIRRKSSNSVIDPAFGAAAGLGGLSGDALAAHHAKMAYNEKQRRKLEQYLQEMIRWLIFRADSNRLCKFLELSALGVRLAAEGSYHGKEGYLIIQNSKGLDFRRVLTPQNIFARHRPKWFLVRHSYIVCVDSPENMHIYDVFLLDSKFSIQTKRRKLKDTGPINLAKKAKSSAAHPQHHRLKLHNSERKTRLLAKNERQLRQFEESIRFMVQTSDWSKPNRFDSFAPVRTGVFAQWLVDGRDYMWNVSRAINMAKDVIYIHDWWLSPQLYMRRPAAISQKWRLDRLLRKKAMEGVKVFIIIYRNVEAAVPIDSELTKFSMLDLHPNVFVQRSPNQYKKNQFFFAHHEKICVIDHTVAFVGGIDLCFGRWDTPQHSVCDDKPTGFEPSDEPKDADHCQLWPGKDYSNPRVQDFFNLNEPYAEMYDRSMVPRMPWHDISMQVVGQPARDLTRHFVQRWNYILRGRKPTRPTPFLLPPPDYNPADLETLGLTGTCEVQILRSASNWSLGLEDTEHSIMTAYCKMIEESEHFVYMENQFFITSTETMNVKIVNTIGDAIVERAIRAFNNGEDWRCVILIPLMPGFQNTVEAPDGTSVRLIMQCQFRSICRGDDSIFGRLRAEGIEPEEYINFYSLRSWGKIGPKKVLVTEQLYIHAKVIIVDDRIALIGSANINERSMIGVRDSECAAVVRDTDMLWSTMAGEPYLVGRFAHTLRMRLMREHLGLDVDEVMEEERRVELDREEEEYEAKMTGIYSEVSDSIPTPEKAPTSPVQAGEVEGIAKESTMRSPNDDHKLGQHVNPNLHSSKPYVKADKRVAGNKQLAAEVDGQGEGQSKVAETDGVVSGRDSTLVDNPRNKLETDDIPEDKGTIEHPKRLPVRTSPPGHNYEGDDTGRGNDQLPLPPQFPRKSTDQLGLPQLSQLPPLPALDDTDIGGPQNLPGSNGREVDTSDPIFADIKPAVVTKDCMRDPLNESFFENIWRLVADNNTKIFRKVFRVNPDNEVSTWPQYREFIAYGERFAQEQFGAKSTTREEQESKGKSGPPGAASALPHLGAVGQGLTHLSEKAAAHGRSEDGKHLKGNAEDWAAQAQAGNESRPQTSDTHQTEPASNSLDEKVALRDSNEVVSPVLPSGDTPFPSVDSNQAVESNKHTEKPSAHRTVFSTPSAETTNSTANQNTSKRRRRTTTKSRRGFSASDDLMSKEDAEQLLNMVQGSLVVFPYDWLDQEEKNSNWLYQVDQVAPLQIYN